MVWLQFHHFKNFVMFWLRLSMILIMTIGLVAIWFIEITREIAPLLFVGMLIGAITFTVSGWKPIKRLYKKYVAYAKRLKANITNLRSMF